MRHADATEVRVRLTTEDSRLRVRVEDDGHGLPDTPVPGLGLLSMRARAEELGGDLGLESGPSGTVVTASLPLALAASGVGG